MDISPRQAGDIQEIEKQVDGIPEPKVLSETAVKDRSVLINLLAALGISIVGTAAVIFLLVIPVQSTVTTDTMQVGSQENVVFQTEYVNPFAATSQYSNPFIATKNPFTAFAQQ